MSDDIVTRLQKGNAYYGDLQTDPNIYQDALSEIERLRAYVLSFPCSCWINKPECVRCEVQAHVG